jgi:hypothetical protein
VNHLSDMELGVATARRGWTEKMAVVNSWPVNRLLGWIRASRSTPGGAS